MTPIKLSVLQEFVLRALVELVGDTEYAFYTAKIAERAMVGPRHARIALRALGRKGLVELVRGLVDEYDGKLMGSGYRPTPAGFTAVRAVAP